jgi:hypothetical protein
MTERFRLRDPLGRERWMEQPAERSLPFRPRGYDIMSEDDVEETRRRQ